MPSKKRSSVEVEDIEFKFGKDEKVLILPTQSNDDIYEAKVHLLFVSEDILGIRECIQTPIMTGSGPQTERKSEGCSVQDPLQGMEQAVGRMGGWTPFIKDQSLESADNAGKEKREPQETETATTAPTATTEHRVPAAAE